MAKTRMALRGLRLHQRAPRKITVASGPGSPKAGERLLEPADELMSGPYGTGWSPHHLRKALMASGSPSAKSPRLNSVLLVNERRGPRRWGIRMGELTYEDLKEAVKARGAAIRFVTRLMPGGGPADKVYPPTYQGGQYISETRRIGDQAVSCVLLDSVQSQANRMEEALLEARRRGQIQFPDLEVDFASAGFPQYGFLSVLQAPHRIADAIFRDSYLDGQPFRLSELGRKFVESTPLNAVGLLELCPPVLVFGAWDSTGLGMGGLGAKFARVIASEIVGVHFAEGKHAAVRVDPLGIQREAAVIYESESPLGWTTDPERARRDERGNPKPLVRGSERGGRPSVINHGNILTDIRAGGVTIAYALQTAVVSLAGLRKLRFPDDSGHYRQERNLAAQTYLAALAVYAILLQQEAGYDLRSRCVLHPIERRVELVPNCPEPTREISLSSQKVAEIYYQAVEGLKRSGFRWDPRVVTLRPSEELLELLRRNQEKIAAGSVD